MGRSRIQKTNGRSIRTCTGNSGSNAAPKTISKTVAAAASVPSSSTFTNTLCGQRKTKRARAFPLRPRRSSWHGGAKGHHRRRASVEWTGLPAGAALRPRPWPILSCDGARLARRAPSERPGPRGRRRRGSRRRGTGGRPVPQRRKRGERLDAGERRRRRDVGRLPLHDNERGDARGAPTEPGHAQRDRRLRRKLEGASDLTALALDAAQAADVPTLLRLLQEMVTTASDLPETSDGIDAFTVWIREAGAWRILAGRGVSERTLALFTQPVLAVIEPRRGIVANLAASGGRQFIQSEQGVRRRVVRRRSELDTDDGGLRRDSGVRRGWSPLRRALPDERRGRRNPLEGSLPRVAKVRESASFVGGGLHARARTLFNTALVEEMRVRRLARSHRHDEGGLRAGSAPSPTTVAPPSSAVEPSSPERR